MKKLVSAVILAFFSVSAALASHLVGGELGIEHIQGNSYKVFMIMYYDHLHGEAGTDESQITVNVFEKNSNLLVRTLTLPKVSSTPIIYTFPACAATSQQTTILRYESQFVFSPTEFDHLPGYYISWERCCRNQGVSNIVEPFESGMVFYMEFPPMRRNGANFINSSPVINPVAGDNICIDELHTYSFAATDKDGDQLRYLMTTPLKGFTSQSFPYPTQNAAPYPLVDWKPGYSQVNAIQGNPQLGISTTTGLLTVRPYYAGLYVFSVVCQEFRNGEKIGEVRRDFQWNVLDCQPNDPPSVALVKPDGSYYQESQTLTVTSSEDQCYRLEFKDKVNSNLTFQVEPINFTSPQLSISPSSGKVLTEGVPVVAELCWPDCSIAREEPYIFDIVVSDKACPIPKSSKLRVRLLVQPIPNDPPVIETSLGANINQYLTIGQPVTFTVTGTDVEDMVTLTAQGQAFSMEALGMQFEGGSGMGTHTAVFSWTPNCNSLNLPQPLRVVFNARDNSCFSQNQDTTSVLFYVTDIVSNIEDFIPANIFSPNADGLNDTFAFPTLPADNCQGRFEKTEVYNRWGEKIYATESRTAAWDASGAPDGIYYYLIKYAGNTYKGTVTVVR